MTDPSQAPRADAPGACAGSRATQRQLRSATQRPDEGLQARPTPGALHPHRPARFPLRMHKAQPKN